MVRYGMSARTHTKTHNLGSGALHIYTAVVCSCRPYSCLCFTSLSSAASFLHHRVCHGHWTDAIRRRHRNHKKNSRTLILCFYDDRREPAAISTAPAFFGISRAAYAICCWPSVWTVNISTNVSYYTTFVPSSSTRVHLALLLGKIIFHFKNRPVAHNIYQLYV